MTKKAPVRLFRADGPDRAAVVSIEPSSWGDERMMIRIARGESFKALTKGTAYGPYVDSEVEDRFAEAVHNLALEGFAPATYMEQLLALKSENSAVRARAALTLGWRRAQETVDPLLSLAETAVDDICSIVDALGAIGDPRAIPLARNLAERKLLSRRRSGVEALRHLGDAEGLAGARQRGIARLPQPLVDALASLDEEDEREASITPLVDATLAEERKRQGLIIDTLYEAGTPAMVAATRMALRQIPMGRPHLWRYTKSIFKRAMLRHDAVTFGWLAHAVESGARTYKGTRGKVKSGYDGVTRETTIFSRRTVNYVRRASWRYLKRLARYRPELYAPTAAEVLIHYSPADAQIPRGFNGTYADCYMLNRILWGGSERLRWDARSMKFKFKSVKDMQTETAQQVESFPELWRSQPQAFLRLLAAGKLPEVQRFGLDGLKEHPEVLRSAGGDILVGMIDSDSAEIVELAASELERRFSRGEPDFDLIEAVLAHASKSVWSIACRWLEGHPEEWISDGDRVIRLLSKARGASLLGFSKICIAALEGASEEARRAIASRLLEELRKGVPDDDLHQGYAIVGREALLRELDPLLSLDELLRLIREGSTPAKTVAAAVLGGRTGGMEALGVEMVLSLSESEVVAVRAAARRLLEGGVAILRQDPSPLFTLAESRWTDNREAAFAMFKEEIELAKLGLDGLIGLCDSTQEDVQAFGRELVTEHFDELDVQELLYKLVEHPSRSMQKFAFELVDEHLRDGVVPLMRIESFFRACLFDLWPDRSLKFPLIDFLVRRALEDERQAELVAKLLSEVVRSRTQADFEKAAEGLVKIQLAWPEIESVLKVVGQGGEG